MTDYFELSGAGSGIRERGRTVQGGVGVPNQRIFPLLGTHLNWCPRINSRRRPRVLRVEPQAKRLKTYGRHAIQEMYEN